VSRVHIPFLPAFLTILGIAFAVVLVARIRSYSGAAGGGAEDGSDVAATSGGTSASAARRSSSTSGDEVGVETTSTIVPSGTTSSGGMSARERQYRELLNAPPPKSAAGAPSTQQQPVHTIAAAKPTEKPQSTISKILQPIKNLFGGGSGAPPVQPQSAARPGTDTSSDKKVDKDPSTDTTPPQVMGVQFDPTRVNDGESAAVIVTATDDLSGIRSISGTVTSPNGKALQGFACQREAPESNRYIGRVAIPKDAEEGQWHINFLNVSDFASNAVTLGFAQSPVLQAAQLTVVSSRSDKTPPTVTAAWIDRRAMRAGEKNTLFVQAQDDKSGVNLVSGVFLSPHQYARIGVPCQQGDGDMWTCTFSVPTCIDCGDWQLEQIQMQDKASNMVSVMYKQSDIVGNVKLNIAGDSCDDTPPVLQSLVMETNSVPSTPEGTSVDVRISVVDDTCGVSNVSGQVIGPAGGQGIFFTFSSAGGDNFVGRMPIPRLAGKGVWKINSLQVIDKGNNLRIYYWNDPLLANARVIVR
jgi:hypothetical protein